MSPAWPGCLMRSTGSSTPPTPGKAALATRLGRLLASGDVVALLTGDPAVAVALLTLRPNVWYDGPVALLDELFVSPEVRGRGLGSALLAAAEEVTRWRGGELLEINVDRDDTGERVCPGDSAAVTVESGSSLALGLGLTCLAPGETHVSPVAGEAGVIRRDQSLRARV